MSIAWGIVALALVGAESPGEKPRFEVRRVDGGGVAVGRTPVEAGQVSYEVRVVDTPASLWRESSYRHCTRVGREGRSTVWTIDDRSASEMLDRVAGDPRMHVLQCPKVTAEAGASCVIDTRHPRSFVVDVDRVADGPADQAASIAFSPAVDTITEGMHVDIKGRKTAAGVRAHVALESTWVGSVVDARTSETIHSKEHGKATVAAMMQIPQVVDAKVDGDFEIPEGRQMLVSLGTVTAIDRAGKPIVMERLAMISARAIVPEAEEKRVDARVARVNTLAAAYLPAPRAMPPVPSRFAPVPIGPDGRVVALPPLPDAMVSPAAHPRVTRPMPSPQMTPAIPIDPTVVNRSEPTPIGLSPLGMEPTRIVAGPQKVDSAITRTRFDVAPSPPKAGATIDGRALAGGGTQTIRIPVSGKLSIELKARVVPADQPE